MSRKNVSVPVAVAAKVYGKDPSWVRAGIITGALPIGLATRNNIPVTDVNEIDSRLGRINYYISPKLLYEHTGYQWKGDSTCQQNQNLARKVRITSLKSDTTN